MAACRFISEYKNHRNEFRQIQSQFRGSGDILTGQNSIYDICHGTRIHYVNGCDPMIIECSGLDVNCQCLKSCRSANGDFHAHSLRNLHRSKVCIAFPGHRWGIDTYTVKSTCLLSSPVIVVGNAHRERVFAVVISNVIDHLD